MMNCGRETVRVPAPGPGAITGQLNSRNCPIMVDEPQDGGEETGPPRLLVFLALHTALGFALGIAFAAVVILTNVAGIKSILEASDMPYVAMIMLFVMCGLTLGSLVVGAAVMSLPRK